MMLNNQKGFLLISVIFIMVLMAVSIFSINYYSVTQIRMASNQTDSVQTDYDLKAIVEQSVWKLTDNLFWRTVVAGEDTSFNGTTYTRIVRNAASNDPTDPLFAYRDAVTIQVTPKGSDQSFQRSFRYYVSNLEISGLVLNGPKKIFVMPSGNLLIADTNNNRVIKVTPDISGFTVIVGTGLNIPIGIGVYSSGINEFIFIADTGNNRILKVDVSNNTITPVAGTGVIGSAGDGELAINATLKAPQGVFVDKNGNIFIADTGNNKIRMVDGIYSKIYTLAGSGVGGDIVDPLPAVDGNANLKGPSGIAMASSYGGSRIFISDTENSKIKVLLLKTVYGL